MARVCSEEQATLIGDFAAPAVKAGLAREDEQNRQGGAEAALDWLEHSRGWLLVLDNAPGVAEVRPWTPKTATGHVLITPRSQNWGGLAAALQLGVHSRNQSVEFPVKKSRRNEAGAARALAAELGDLPLALEQAASFINGTSGSIGGYRKLYQERASELLAKRDEAMEYPLPAEASVRLALDRLDKENPAALDLLRLFAFPAPDAIPLDLLAGGKARLPKRLQALFEDEMARPEANGSLRKYSLIEARDGAYSVHRIVQAAVRSRLKRSNEEETWAGAAVECVGAAFEYNENDLATRPSSDRLAPHALSAADHAGRAGAALAAASRLWNEVGLFMLHRGQLVPARTALERALGIAERTCGPGHPSVAVCANVLGVILAARGELPRARRLNERALGIAERTCGPGHPSVAICANALGVILVSQGELAGARRLTERAPLIWVRFLWPERPNTRIVEGRLRAILRAVGESPSWKRPGSQPGPSSGQSSANYAVRLSSAEPSVLLIAACAAASRAMGTR